MPTSVERVLMTADAVGGVWPYALDLARGLGARGARVDLAIMGPAPSVSQRQDARAAGIVLHELPYRLEWMDEPWPDVDRAGEALLDLATEIRPDIVHLNGFCHAALPWPSPVVVVAHSCVRSWWRAVHGAPAPAAFDEYTRRVTRGLHAASIVVAPSRAMLRNAAREYGPLGRTAVIANGRSAIAVHDVAREPVVLTAGRLWDRAKNVETVSAAAATLTWPVFVAGDDCDPQGRRITPACAGYLGRLEPAAMAAWFARASIYALPARYEPFGLSVLEAAAAGCALVLGDIPSLRENWDGAALFVPSDDVRAVAAATQGLIDDHEGRRQLSRAALARAGRFSVERMTDAYFSTYAALASAEAA